MQVAGSQNNADGQHAIYSLMARDAPGDPPFQDTGFQGHNLWESSQPEWHLDGYAIHQQTTSYAAHPREQEQPHSLTGARRTDYYPVTSFQIPPEEWPSNFALGAVCDQYGNPIASPTTTLYPPTPQSNFVTPLEALELRDETERDNESFSPVPTSPDEYPPGTQKRHRNRLAAAKCRKKAKRGVNELQQRERDLLRENKMLSAEAGLLREEILQLKCEILRHSECDNDYIRQYIQRAAEQVGKAQSEDNTGGILSMPATRYP